MIHYLSKSPLALYHSQYQLIAITWINSKAELAGINTNRSRKLRIQHVEQLYQLHPMGTSHRISHQISGFPLVGRPKRILALIEYVLNFQGSTQQASSLKRVPLSKKILNLWFFSQRWRCRMKAEIPSTPNYLNLSTSMPSFAFAYYYQCLFEHY